MPEADATPTTIPDRSPETAEHLTAAEAEAEREKAERKLAYILCAPAVAVGSSQRRRRIPFPPIRSSSSLENRVSFTPGTLL